MQYGNGNASDCRTESEWSVTLQRLGPLQPILEQLSLRLTATGAARSIGLRSPSELRRWLTDRRLPPFQLLRDWYYVVRLIERFTPSENGSPFDVSLANWALREGKAPSVYYMFVLRVAERPWSVLRSSGPRIAKERALRMWDPYTTT
ncbi:hypothetical protein [Gemmatimonas sp.]|jgi:hypothetical protein|uniref:hypothetical protein n=1 Tax=Gemmatimonas sp. TaxID=1962908 RepID=UPI0037BE91EE